VATQERHLDEQERMSRQEGQTQPGLSRSLLWLLPLLAIFLVLSVCYHYGVPLFEAPDEPSHIEYLAFLHQEGRLPRHEASPDVPGEGIQPPLYYLMAWPSFATLSSDGSDLYRSLHRVNWHLYGYGRSRPLDLAQPLILFRIPGGKHSKPRVFEEHPHLSWLLGLRWVSLFFGVLAVAATFFAAIRITGSLPASFLAAGLLGFNPQFLFVCNYVNNDSAAAALGAAAFYLVATSLTQQGGHPARRHYLFLGLLIAAGFLLKKTAIPGLAVAALALISCDSRPIRRRLADAGSMVGVALLLAAPYLYWNLRVHGDPFGIGVEQAANALLPGPEQYGGLWPYFSKVYFSWTFESYWAWFGWMNLQAPLAAYWVFLALTCTGIVGFMLQARRPARVEALHASSHREGRARHSMSQPPVLVLRSLQVYLLGAILSTLAAHAWFNVHVVQPQGRHLFPVAPQIAFLLAVGLASIGGRSATSRVRAGAIGISLLILVSLAIYCLVCVILPAYRT
jgi:hypothetical protein